MFTNVRFNWVGVFLVYISMCGIGAGPVTHMDDMEVYLMLGSSRCSPFFLSTTLRTRPMTSAATPKPASITNGAV